ncbi:MAG TPA: group III truncated hemoglobin [Puia sp.]|jgi:hemoglobin
MKRDIAGNEDVRMLVDTFYRKVKMDPLIGFIFTDIVHVNWEKHLPVMYAFWEQILFYTGNYAGNPMEIHKHVHQLTPLRTEQFDRWIKLFYATVDELFSGEKAELAKERALSIATMMKIKILQK